MQPPGERVAVAEYLNRYLHWVGKWCDLLRMTLNANTARTIIVSRSRLCIIHLEQTPLTLDGTVLKESDDLVIFCDI